MTANKTKGTLCGIIAAITYGTNPLGALNLYAAGINTDSVLFYRYSLSALLLFAIMLVQKSSFKISRKEFAITFILGVIFAISSLSLFMSFNYMDAGIASSILFIYPVMVSIIMTVFFKEKISSTIIVSITLALSGITLLYEPNGQNTLSSIGVLLVMLSALSYAIYIVIVNQSMVQLSPIKLTFFVMLFGTLVILTHSSLNTNNHIQALPSANLWGWALMLAIFPTVISLVLTVIAIKEIGSTATAIMGALEPITAIIIGVGLFNESFSSRLACGILLIIAAVMLIILNEHITKRMKRLKRIRHIHAYRMHISK